MKNYQVYNEELQNYYGSETHLREVPIYVKSRVVASKQVG